MLCRSPSRTPSRSPPKAAAHGNSVSSQHVSDMQTSSSQHMSESSSHRHPSGRSPLSRAAPRRDHSPSQPPSSPLRASANSFVQESASTFDRAAPRSPAADALGPARPPEASPASAAVSAVPQADATVHVHVQRSFLAAAKQGRNASPASNQSRLTGKSSSPGNSMAMAYSASSEDGTSTSGRSMTMHSLSANVVSALCACCAA